MSTYVEVTGWMRMDRKAFASFAASKAGLWLVPRHDRSPIKDPECLLVSANDDGTIEVSASGLVRNLGRYLAPAVIDAGAAGQLRGAFEVHCSDGTTYREVLVASEAGVHVGTAACLNETVELTVPSFHVIEELSMHFVVDGAPTGVRVGVIDVDHSCSCGGWDDDETQPICTTDPHETNGIADYLPTRIGEADLAVMLTEWIAEATGEELLALGQVCANGDTTWRGLLEQWGQRYPEVTTPTVTVRYDARPFDREGGETPQWRIYPTRRGAYRTEPGDSGDSIPQSRVDEVVRAAVALHDDNLHGDAALQAARALILDR